MKRILFFSISAYISLIPTFAATAPVPSFSDQHYRDADRLFSKLNNYAATNSVPMHWRQY